MTRLVKRGILAGVVVLVLAVGALAALYLLPVSVTVGPCLMDPTSLSTYRSRVSPLAATSLRVPGGTIKVCYGRPAARGRIIFGSLVPYDQYWRLGANEPTRLYTDVPLDFAGLSVPPGRYSLYAIPRRDRWTIAVNRSRFHWGTDFSERVISRELGRVDVPPGRTRGFVEHLTIRLVSGAAPDQALLTIEWEHTRVEVPLSLR